MSILAHAGGRLNVLHDADSINLVKSIKGMTVYSTKESALRCCSALNVLVLICYFTDLLVNTLHMLVHTRTYTHTK